MTTSASNTHSKLGKLLLGQREKWLSGLGAFIAISWVIFGTSDCCRTRRWLSCLPWAPPPCCCLPSPRPAVTALAGIRRAYGERRHWGGGTTLVARRLCRRFGGGRRYLSHVFLRCLHPPGGATALMAVIGGSAVHQLGWAFVWQVSLLNVLLILIAALAFNAPFPWRRYPSGWHSKPPSPLPFGFAQEDFAAAITEIDTLVDVSPEDLQQLVRLACEHAQAKKHLDAL